MSPDLSHKKCCVLHDYVLVKKKVGRVKADKMLFECIRDQYIEPIGTVMAAIYWVFARLYSISGLNLYGNK